MPRQIVTALIIKEQAGISPDHVLVRDYQSGDDEILDDNATVDLSRGNVFKAILRCDSPANPRPPKGQAKLAYFVDDNFQFAVAESQSEASIRRLFNLAPEVQLLRDLEGPNDAPIEDNQTVHFKDGPVFLSCYDLERHCGKCDQPPKVRKYVIRIDAKRYVTDNPNPTGAEILKLAGKSPTDWLLNQKINKHFVAIDPDKHVDLTACGVERFTTLPNEQSEGRPSPRRQFTLPEEDTDALNSSGRTWETLTDDKTNWLVIHGVHLPDVFEQHETSVAIQIPSGYPPAALDMAFFYPPIKRKDGRTIANTESSSNIDGKSWQRWSRHYTPANPWKPEYNTYTHLVLSESWLKREAKK